MIDDRCGHEYVDSAFLEGEKARDTELLDQALRDRQLLMVPVVLTELLSDPNLPVQVTRTLCDVPAVEIGSEYWQRAGALRAKVGEATTSTPRRRIDRTKLHRWWSFAPRARPRFPGIYPRGGPQTNRLACIRES